MLKIDSVKKLLPTFVAITVLTLMVWVKVIEPPFINQMKLWVFDGFQKLSPRKIDPVLKMSTQVKIIDIDDESLKKIGQWPWPRTYIAEMQRRLTLAGAAVVAYDIIFAEIDRTSPSAAAEIWGLQNIPKEMKNLPDHDSVYSEMIEASNNVVTSFSLIHETNDSVPSLKSMASLKQSGEDLWGGSENLDVLKEKLKAGKIELNDSTIKKREDAIKSAIEAHTGSEKSLSVLENVARGNGFMNSANDDDGILRRIPMLRLLKNENGSVFYPSLVLETLRVFKNSNNYLISTVGGEGDNISKDTITGVTVGDMKIPLTKNAELWLHFSEAINCEEDSEQKQKNCEKKQQDMKNIRYIPAWKVFQDDFETELVKNNILFVGTSAEGLRDIRSTPLQARVSGTELHAQAMEQILLKDFLIRPDYASGIEFTVLIVLGLVMIIIMEKLSSLYAANAMIAAQILVFSASYYAFSSKNILLEPVSSTLAVFVIYFTGSLSRYMSVERERKNIRNAFSRYMSPDLVNELADDPSSLKLGGETRNLTVMFSDIRGFTTISEGYSAEELIGFVNSLLAPLSGIILNNHGTIDKYIGDNIMSFWNAPLDDPKHQENACRSALFMRDKVIELNPFFQEKAKSEGRIFSPIKMGIGINSGDCCVGNMGTEQRFDYSVLGDDVNLASRLEGQSKNYGVDIIIGESTSKAVPMLATMEIDLIRVKGKTRPTRIYTLLGDENLKNKSDFAELTKTFSEMLENYRQENWEAALKLLRNFYEASKESKLKLEYLCSVYLQRIYSYQDTPPPYHWEGVYDATSK
jgi:adenylate cyclase